MLKLYFIPGCVLQHSFSKRRSEYFYLIICFAFLAVTSQIANAADLFKIMALPELPLALKKDQLEEKDSRLQIEHSREEIYRKWVNGEEVSRFDGNRSKIMLRLNFFADLYIEGAQYFKARQTIFNKDTDKSSELDFNNNENHEELALSYRGKHNFFETKYEFFKDQLAGKLELEDSARDAIGGNPRLSLISKRFRRSYKWLYRKNRFTFKATAAFAKASEIINARPVNMKLNLPLERNDKTHELEIDYRLTNNISPFLRYRSIKMNGYGESYRDNRFRFGFTNLLFKQNTKAIGAVFHGRHPWFLEIEKHSISFEAQAKNNLITLNPLMLFNVNEITQTEILPDTSSPGFRIGGLRRLKNLQIYLQYGYMKLDTTRQTTEFKISNFRKDKNIANLFTNETIALHRLNTEIVKRDKSGKWRFLLKLMVPETRQKDDKAPSTAPPATPSPAISKDKEQVRGGWQASLIREFNF